MDNTPETEELEKRVPKKAQSTAADLYDWLEVFAMSVAIVFVIFAFVARVAVVDGSSMTDTLHDKDKLLVGAVLHPGSRGHCRLPVGILRLREPIVKRVIATEGQTVKIDFENWKVYVDGTELEEDYVNT